MTEATILAALVAVSGGVLGAWLNSMLTTRRERWALKRELYQRLLENLWEFKVRMRLLSEQASRSHLDAMIRAVEEVRRARAIAGVMLSDEACRAIDALSDEWDEARHSADSATNKAKTGAALADRAYAVIVEAARRDLGLR